MAAHVRQQIREAIGAALAGLPTTGARVYTSRLYELQESELPALRIYSESETSAPLTINGPRIDIRTLQIKINAVAKATVSLDDILDAICLEVELALANPVAALLPLAQMITLTGTEIELQGTAEQPTGEATMTFEVEYQTAENAPDVAL